MQCCNFETADLAFLKDFEPPGWGDLVPRFEHFLASPVCYPLKLVTDNKMVAIGASIMHRNTAWLACIIVHLDYRNKGLGKLITQQLIANIDTQHYKTIYLEATDLGYPVYKKLGFELDAEYIYLKTDATFYEGHTSECIVLFDKKFRSQLYALDQQVSGEQRSAALEEHITTSKIYLHKCNIQGFYMPTLGDGLIVANTPQAGIALMKCRLQTQKFAILPLDNAIAIDFLKQQHFYPVRIGRRLFLGEKRIWQPQNLYNRISGQLG